MVFKLSYPNFDAGTTPLPKYDLAKWINSFKNIQLQAYYGTPEAEAFKQATSSWNKMERLAFENWIKYYKETKNSGYGVKANIKTAQSKNNFYISEDIPGYFLPNPKNVPSPIKNNLDFDSNPADMFNRPEAISEENKRKIIEDQRKKMVGRLHSLEKLLTSSEGRTLAGNDFDALLNAIFDLKKQIHSINKLSVSNTIYSDLIIRKANILERAGFNGGSTILKKIAQLNPGAGQVKEGPIPLGSQIDGTGTLQNPNPSLDSLTSTPPIEISENKPDVNTQGPGTQPQNPTSQTQSNIKSKPKGKEFEGLEGALDNLGTFGLTDADDAEDIEIDAFKYPAFITVEAQEALSDGRREDLSPKDIINAPADLEESDKQEAAKIDDLINGALNGITVDDVIKKIKNILAIYKRRELVRQLSTIDLMLDKLGLSAYFDSLNEVINKSADSSLYISTRLEDMLARLQSATVLNTVDLNPPTERLTPGVEQVKKNLEEQDKIDESKKRVKQKVQEKNLTDRLKDNSKEVPVVETIPEELTNPIVKSTVPLPPPTPAEIAVPPNK